MKKWEIFRSKSQIQNFQNFLSRSFLAADAVRTGADITVAESGARAAAVKVAVHLLRTQRAAASLPICGTRGY